MDEEARKTIAEGLQKEIEYYNPLGKSGKEYFELLKGVKRKKKHITVLITEAIKKKFKSIIHLMFRYQKD